MLEEYNERIYLPTYFQLLRDEPSFSFLSMNVKATWDALKNFGLYKTKWKAVILS